MLIRLIYICRHKYNN